MKFTNNLNEKKIIQIKMLKYSKIYSNCIVFWMAKVKKTLWKYLVYRPYKNYISSALIFSIFIKKHHNIFLYSLPAIIILSRVIIGY